MPLLKTYIIFCALIAGSFSPSLYSMSKETEELEKKIVEEKDKELKLYQDQFDDKKKDSKDKIDEKIDEEKIKSLLKEEFDTLIDKCQKNAENIEYIKALFEAVSGQMVEESKINLHRVGHKELGMKRIDEWKQLGIVGNQVSIDRRDFPKTASLAWKFKLGKIFNIVTGTVQLFKTRYLEMKQIALDHQNQHLDYIKQTSDKNHELRMELEKTKDSHEQEKKILLFNEQLSYLELCDKYNVLEDKEDEYKKIIEDKEHALTEQREISEQLFLNMQKLNVLLEQEKNKRTEEQDNYKKLVEDFNVSKETQKQAIEEYKKIVIQLIKDNQLLKEENEQYKEKNKKLELINGTVYRALNKN